MRHRAALGHPMPTPRNRYHAFPRWRIGNPPRSRHDPFGRRPAGLSAGGLAGDALPRFRAGGLRLAHCSGHTRHMQKRTDRQSRGEPRYPWTRRRRSGWQAVVTIAGKRVYGPERESRELAYEDAQFLRARVARAGPGPSVSATAAVARWMEYHERENKPGTCDFYRSKIKRWTSAVGDETPLWSVTGEQLERFLEKLRSQGLRRSIPSYRRTLSSFFGWAHGEGLIRENPLDEIPKTRLRALGRGAKTDRYHWLPEPAIVRICALLDTHAPWPNARMTSDVIRLLYLSGLRRAEACRLTTQHISFEQGLIYVDSKRPGVFDEQQLIAITNELEPVLRRLIERARARGQSLLLWRNPERMNDALIQARKWLAREHGRDFEGVSLDKLSAHALRHSLGTNLIRKGVPLSDVQKILRHTTPTMTSRYVHANAPDLRRSAAAVSLAGDSPEPHAEAAPPAPEPGDPARTAAR